MFKTLISKEKRKWGWR